MENRIKEIILHEYNFIVKTIDKLQGGFCEDETYVISTFDQKKYVVKYIQYDFSFQHLQLILTFENLLHDSYKYPCPRIILSKTNQYLIQDNKRFLFIQTFIEGIEPNKEILDEDQSYLIQMGRLLAQWRIISRNFNFNLQRDEYEEFTDQWWKQQINSDHIHPFLLSNLIQCQKQLRNINEKFECGLIHNDFHSNNCMLTNDRIIFMIDFVDAYRSAFIADLATSLFHLLIDQHQGINRAKVFLKGYQQIISLESQEIQFIDLFVKFKLTSSIIEDVSKSTDENHPFIQSCFHLLNTLNHQPTFVKNILIELNYSP